MRSSTANQKTLELPLWGRLLDYASGDRMTRQFSAISQVTLVPLVAMLVFLMLWSVGARNVETSLGQLPGPAKVWEQAKALYGEHREEREKQAAFEQRMQKRLFFTFFLMFSVQGHGLFPDLGRSGQLAQ